MELLIKKKRVPDATQSPISNGVLNSFSVFNVHGLKPNTVPSKVPYIADLLSESKQLFMAVTETWLSNHKDGELEIDGYKLFRGDRKRVK